MMRSRAGGAGVSGRAGRWLIAPTLGAFFGWITAATTVSFATTFVALGLLGAAMVKAGAGPTLYLPYAAAVLWALVAVVFNQYDASVPTTGAAAISPAGVPLVFSSVRAVVARAAPAGPSRFRVPAPSERRVVGRSRARSRERTRKRTSCGVAGCRRQRPVTPRRWEA